MAEDNRSEAQTPATEQSGSSEVLPALAGLSARLDEIEPRDYASALALCRPFAADLSWITSVLSGWLDRAAADASFQPPMFGIQDHGLEFEDSSVTVMLHPLVAITVTPRFGQGPTAPPEEVTFTGRSALVRFVGEGAAKIRWWRCTPMDDKSDI